MTSQSGPSVFEYLDLCTYLQSYYAYRKKTHKKFTYESWSIELDFNKSRSFLRMILIGKKKASKSFIEAFSQQALETILERDYFLCLVKYSQAGTKSEREMYGRSLIQILRTNTPYQIIENYADFVSTPFLPRLFTLVSFKDVHPTVENYQRLLGVSREQIQGGLEVLERLDLVERDKSKGVPSYRTKNDRFKVSDDKGSQNLMTFHTISLHEAVSAFAKPRELRSYKSLFLAMNEEELLSYYKAINDFASEQIAKFTPTHLEDRRIFQINFNNYAVTDSIEQADEAAGQ